MIEIKPIESELVYSIHQGLDGWYILWVNAIKKSPTQHWASIMTYNTYVAKYTTKEECEQAVENYKKHGFFLAYPT